MIDTFVSVAPIYLLGVIALLGFVGCQAVFPVDEGTADPAEPPAPPQPPANIHTEAGDGVVTLLWDPFPDALLFEIDRQISPPGIIPVSYDFLAGVTPAQLPIINGFMAYEDQPVTNGITYHYVVRTVTGDGTSVSSPDIEATPTTPFGPFVTMVNKGSERAGEDHWFGFVVVPVVPVTVHKLGRYYSPLNMGTHDIIIIDAASLQILGTTTVSLASEGLNDFRYGDVKPSPVQLNQNDEYFLVSLEETDGDDFLTQDTTVETNAEAQVTNAVESSDLVTFTTAGGPGHAYGPVDFQY